MTGCSAVNCSNSSTKGFKMCRIPRDESRKKIWTQNINRPNWTPSIHSVICEVHFSPQSWEVMPDGKKKLKSNAVPTLFPHRTLLQPLIENSIDAPEHQSHETMIENKEKNLDVTPNIFLTESELQSLSDNCLSKCDQSEGCYSLEVKAEGCENKNVQKETRSISNSSQISKVSTDLSQNPRSEKSNVIFSFDDHDYAVNNIQQAENLKGSSSDFGRENAFPSIIFMPSSNNCSSCQDKDATISHLKQCLDKLKKLYTLSEKSRVTFKRKLNASREENRRLNKKAKALRGCPSSKSIVFEMPLNNAEKCKNYRDRKKIARLKMKKTPLTPAERARMYRLRKKLLAQGIKSSANEVLYTPSTSDSRMTFEPSPQPVTTNEDSESQVAYFDSEDENSLLKPRGSSHKVPVFTPSLFKPSSLPDITNENPEDDHCKSCFQLLDSAACRYACVECAWRACAACEAAGAHAAHAVLRAPPNRTRNEINAIVRLVREQIELLQETGEINCCRVKIEPEEEKNTEPLQFAEATIAESFSIDIVKEELPLEYEENDLNENVDEEDHSRTLSPYPIPQAPNTGEQMLQNVTPANTPMLVQSTHTSVKRTMTIPQSVIQAKVLKPGPSSSEPRATLLKPGTNVPIAGVCLATPGPSIVIKPGLSIEISPRSSNVSEPGPSLMTSSTVVTKTGTAKVRKKVTPARPAPKIDIASDDDATSDMSIKSEPESEGEEIIS